MVKRVLIIRFSALGDVAMLVPIVRAAAEQYPSVSFTVLSQQRMADLFADMPGNVTFHAVNLKEQSLHEIVRKVGAFDAVADMHNVLRSVYIRSALLMRGARVASIRKGRLGKYLLTHRWRKEPLMHTTERYAEVLKRLGLPIRMPAAVHSKGEGVGIAPFAAHRGKIYPIERMEQVVKILSEKGIKIVLFGGGRQEKEVLEKWAKRYTGVESVTGRYSLTEELAHMQELRLMVTMDSGNMHLASLVGTRVLSVWGSTHPNAGFIGYGQQESDCIQRDLPCRPCSIYGNKKCSFGDYRCLDITPEEIADRISEAYANRD